MRGSAGPPCGDSRPEGEFVRTSCANFTRHVGVVGESRGASVRLGDCTGAPRAVVGSAQKRKEAATGHRPEDVGDEDQ